MIVCFFPITFMFAALVARGAFGFAGASANPLYR
jgi:hypothetical protein